VLVRLKDAKAADAMFPDWGAVVAATGGAAPGPAGEKTTGGKPGEVKPATAPDAHADAA